MSKYVCPKCGGKLKYWKEIIVEKSRDINPKTGKLYKKITTVVSDMSGCGNEGITMCFLWLFNKYN